MTSFASRVPSSQFATQAISTVIRWRRPPFQTGSSFGRRSRVGSRGQSLSSGMDVAGVVAAVVSRVPPRRILTNVIDPLGHVDFPSEAVLLSALPMVLWSLSNALRFAQL